jgi:hypothetical protein
MLLTMRKQNSNNKNDLFIRLHYSWLRHFSIILKKRIAVQNNSCTSHGVQYNTVYVARSYQRE